jgi:hypothetical protein
LNSRNCFVAFVEEVPEFPGSLPAGLHQDPVLKVFASGMAPVIPEPVAGLHQGTGYPVLKVFPETGFPLVERSTTKIKK